MLFHSPRIVTDGLVLYLDAANGRSYPGSGTGWNDISGNSNNGTLTNGPTYSGDNLGYFNFDGVDDYVGEPTLFLGSDPLFSVSMWIKRTTSFSSKGYWGLGGGAYNNGINSYIYPGRNNKIGVDLWGRTTFDTSQDYPLNEWVNVVWTKIATTFTDSSFKIFINGIYYPLNYTSRNVSSVVNLTDGFSIGRVSDNVSGYYAPGIIAMCNVYNRALTDDEIKQNFNATRGRFGL